MYKQNVLLNKPSSIRLCCLFLILFVFTISVQGQENSSGDFSSREAVIERLESLRLEISEANLPAEISEGDPLQQLEIATYQHLEAVESLAEMVEKAKIAQEELSAWTGFEDQPSFSVRFVLDLRAQQQSLELETRSTEALYDIIQRTIESTSAQLGRHQQNARQLIEKADDAVSIEEEQNYLLAVQNEELAARIQAELLARFQSRGQGELVLKSAVEARLTLANLQLAEALKKLVFTKDELSELQGEVEKTRIRLLKEVQKAESGQLDVMPQNSWKIEILNIERDFWNLLFEALNQKHEARQAVAISAIGTLKERIDDWVEVVNLQTTHYVGGGSPVVSELLSKRDLDRVTELQGRFEFVISLLTDKGVEVQGFINTLSKDALALWNSELYLVEQTGYIAGEKVTTFRAVTLGKLFRLAGVLIVGWFLLRLFSRLVRKLITKFSTVPSDAAATAGAWSFGIGLAILLIAALNWVHIPFSAFAFLGGTLAIGIGFGAQTLLKNFISGIMLRFERPFKVGDLVEVEEFMGRIKHIGLRASTIRDFDGVETLVPNSALVENRVNNWTLGDTALRSGINIGVAYGTSTREVARLLQAVAEKHGLVLERPEPEVRFEDFGDNSLKFSLLFWFDAAQTQRDAIASDLRFMIDRALSEAGVIIAYPQRDIHFDDSRPLRVEFTKGHTE